MANIKQVAALALASTLAAAGCGKKEQGEAIAIDGSSTVFPITQAVAEEYQARHGGRVTVGVSGTGGGFKKLCRGEIAMAGASRPIKPTELEACATAGIELIELPIAYDGLAVVVHKDNTWVDHITVAELKKMWEPEAQATITRWSQIRDGWPDESLRLFGPGVDSGTYDYFTAAIVGKEHASRGDFTASEDDNILVQGVATDRAALGFFGYAYYKENADKIKVVPVDDGNDDNGAGPIAPSLDTVIQGIYQPLSRPIFLYVRVTEASRPEVEAFVKLYLGDGRKLVEEVGYIPLPDDAYTLAAERFARRTPGTLFQGGSKVGVTISDLLRAGK